MKKTLPCMPKSWSELSWQQLTLCWEVKMRYGGNPDVARCAALLVLLGLRAAPSKGRHVNTDTGETAYLLIDKKKVLYTVTPRELSQMAKHSLSWFDYPYGDTSGKEERDENGDVIKEQHVAHRGYVGPMYDALSLPIDRLKIKGRMFALPQVACANLTWQQYRSLQIIAPQLFADNITKEEAIELRAQFLAHCLTPRSFALFDTYGGSIRLRPHFEFRYNSEQAEGLVGFWRKRIMGENCHSNLTKGIHNERYTANTLFHICFQTYQTSIINYYTMVYPLLFTGGGKNDKMEDALTGETGTLNSIMKYQGYTSPQEVYDANLPIILSTLNNMTKEAKEIEKMNAKIKKNKP